MCIRKWTSQAPEVSLFQCNQPISLVDKPLGLIFLPDTQPQLQKPWNTFWKFSFHSKIMNPAKPFHFVQGFLPFQHWSPSDSRSFAHQPRSSSQATHILPPGCSHCAKLKILLSSSVRGYLTLFRH